MRKLCLAWLVVSIGCASTPIKKQDMSALAKADARVLDGCYDCLLEARGIYEKVAVGKARPLVIARLFETQLLLSLREKELAIDATASIAKARALAKEMPPLAEAGRYLALLDLVPTDSLGTPRRERPVPTPAQQAAIQALNGELAWLKTATSLREPVRQYLSLSVDCGYLSRIRQPDPAGSAGLWMGMSRAMTVPPETVPLVAYRAAVCDNVSPKPLDIVRALVPAFAETGFFLARLEVGNVGTTGGLKARPLLEEAYARFPKSSSVTYLSGNFNQISGNCRDALRFYDETIALRSVHEDALLGRTMCLTSLKRHDEAIASATHMIDLRTDNWGLAYYWRSRNYHYLKQLPAARADIERAKMLARNEQVYTLAGLIEHDQDDLGIAETDLLAAKGFNRANRNCVAMWYLGLVKLKQEQWGDSAKNFDDSMRCYNLEVLDNQAAKAKIEANADLDPFFKASQLTAFDAAIKDDQKQFYAAAFNAANQYAHSGNIARANVLIEVAAKDPDLADLVKQLRDLLKDARDI